MRDYFAPIINGVDCSGLVNAYSFQCEPFTRDGGSGGTMRDGTQINDVLARKIRLSWTLNSLSSAKYAELYAATKGEHVSAIVFDPTINDRRTGNFHVTFPPWALAFRPPGQNPMSLAGDDATLVLEEV